MLRKVLCCLEQDVAGHQDVKMVYPFIAKMRWTSQVHYMWKAGHILTYPEIGMLLYVDSGIVCHVSIIVQLGSSAAITHHTENASTESKDSQ